MHLFSFLPNHKRTNYITGSFFFFPSVDLIYQYGNELEIFLLIVFSNQVFS